MIKYSRVLSVAVIALTLSACGAVHNTVLKQPTERVVMKQAALLPVEVVSLEQNGDALLLNTQWRGMAEEQLRTMLAGKKITVTNAGPTKIACRIEVTYGNRALRYFVGFGAGSGRIKVTIEMKDATGNVVYAANSEAKLSVGGFGGNMSDVAREAIQTAVNEFSTKL